MFLLGSSHQIKWSPERFLRRAREISEQAAGRTQGVPRARMWRQRGAGADQRGKEQGHEQGLSRCAEACGRLLGKMGVSAYGEPYMEVNIEHIHMERFM